MPATGASAISISRPSERYLTSGVDGDGRRLVRSLRNKPPLALLYDLAPPIHNANARELQRDVDSDIVFHGCPPSKMPGADSTSRPRFIIYRGTASFTAHSVQGPLRHLVASSTILAERVKVSIKGLRRMDVRRGPMHNDRDLHGLAVTRS